jgi:hypothetical protein
MINCTFAGSGHVVQWSKPEGSAAGNAHGRSHSAVASDSAYLSSEGKDDHET